MTLSLVQGRAKKRRLGCVKLKPGLGGLVLSKTTSLFAPACMKCTTPKLRIRKLCSQSCSCRFGKSMGSLPRFQTQFQAVTYSLTVSTHILTSNLMNVPCCCLLARRRCTRMSLVRYLLWQNSQLFASILGSQEKPFFLSVTWRGRKLSNLHVTCPHSF